MSDCTIRDCEETLDHHHVPCPAPGCDCGSIVDCDESGSFAIECSECDGLGRLTILHGPVGPLPSPTAYGPRVAEEEVPF